MDRREILKSTVAEILGRGVDEVAPDSPLRVGRLRGSIGGGILDAAIRRRLGITCRAAYTASTYGELEVAVLTGEAAAEATERTEPASPADRTAAAVVEVAPTSLGQGLDSALGPACGIDVEMVGNLPDADDYWDSEFYREMFTSAEIAYCASQGEPKPHFAARWCAKEALKKCGADYLELEFGQIELVREASGRPILQVWRSGREERIRAAVSMTHTALFAAAIVVFPDRDGRGPSAAETLSGGSEE